MTEIEADLNELPLCLGVLRLVNHHVAATSEAAVEGAASLAAAAVAEDREKQEALVLHEPNPLS